MNQRVKNCAPEWKLIDNEFLKLFFIKNFQEMNIEAKILLNPVYCCLETEQTDNKIEKNSGNSKCDWIFFVKSSWIKFCATKFYFFSPYRLFFWVVFIRSCLWQLPKAGFKYCVAFEYYNVFFFFTLPVFLAINVVLLINEAC